MIVMMFGFGKKKINTLASDKKESDYKKVGNREFWDVSIWVFGFIYRMEPLRTLVFLSTSVLSNFSDIVYTFIFAKIIDVLVKASTNGVSNLSDIYPYIALIVVYGIANRIISYIGVISDYGLRMLTEPKITRALYTRLNYLGIQTLEKPQVNDRIYRASESTDYLCSYMQGLVEILSSFIQIVVTFVIVVKFFPIFVPIVLLVSIPFYYTDKVHRGASYKFIYDHAENSRSAMLSSNDLGLPAKLNEVTVIQAFNFLDRKFFNFKIWYEKKLVSINTKRRFFNNFFAFLGDLAVYAGFVVVFSQLVKKVISVGDVTFRVNLLSRFQSSFTHMITMINNKMEQALRMRDIYLLYQETPAFKDGSIEHPKLSKGPEIDIKNMSFKYPNTEKPIFNNLGLNIKSGEKVAIVGHNGAGKTTLVKLLCRIYQPTQGEIYVNNQVLKDIKIDTWYQNMGVLFQEFNTYPQLTVKENIVIGSPNEPVDEVALHLAAQSADASSFIDEFPAKYDQILSEKFKGGVRPSTGQWQKLAIARFFYRNAPLVIFDEPTASIDAVSEYNIFNKIYDFFKEKTVIIISHRFSTVRNADRIIVLDHGEIVEQGTHSFLMSNNGYYAKAFNLQAKGYSGSGGE